MNCFAISVISVKRDTFQPKNVGLLFQGDDMTTQHTISKWRLKNIVDFEIKLRLEVNNNMF